MNWLDWKLRWLTQEILNWGGLRFGLTRLGVLTQSLILFWVVNLANIYFHGDLSAFFIFITVVAVLTEIALSFALYVGTRMGNKENEIWVLFKLWRRFVVLIVIVFSILEVLYHVLSWMPHPSHLAWYHILPTVKNSVQAFCFYVAACIDPPPRKKAKKVSVKEVLSPVCVKG